MGNAIGNVPVVRDISISILSEQMEAKMDSDCWKCVVVISCCFGIMVLYFAFDFLTGTMLDESRVQKEFIRL